MLNSMINVSFWNILKLVRTGSFPTPAKHLPLVVLKIDEAEGMEAFPESGQPGRGVVGMGSVIVDRETVVNIQDTAVVAAERKLPETVLRYIYITGKHITKVVCVRSGSD